jgi:hypothetical protein
VIDADDAQLVSLGALGLQNCHVGDRETMVFVVIGQERLRTVFVLDAG